MKWQESETVRNLLKKQNSLLGDSLEALDHRIYLQKSINLLSSESSEEISKVMAEKLPSILSVNFFFLFDKDRRKLRLLSHNHPELQEGLTLYQSVTVSCGIAEFDSNLIKSPVDLVKVADEALYKAKNEGRNRTIVGTP